MRRKKNTNADEQPAESGLRITVRFLESRGEGDIFRFLQTIRKSELHCMMAAALRTFMHAQGFYHRIGLPQAAFPVSFAPNGEPVTESHEESAGCAYSPEYDNLLLPGPVDVVMEEP